MALAEHLYRDCSRILGDPNAPGRVRTRGGASFDPLIWESILLTVHFLCVLHALHEREVFKRLANSWREAFQRESTGADIEGLREETVGALQTLEGKLCDGVISPIQGQIDSARKAVHEILTGYLGPNDLSSTAASDIVSKVVETLDEHSKPRA